MSLSKILGTALFSSIACNIYYLFWMRRKYDNDVKFIKDQFIKESQNTEQRHLIERLDLLQQIKDRTVELDNLDKECKLYKDTLIYRDHCATI
jgi:hypothetical protein